MTSLGTTHRSITKQEMLGGLGYPRYYSNIRLSEDYKQSTQKLNQNNLIIANKIFVNHKFTIKPSYHDLVLEGFKSKPESIDFSNSNLASNTINEWVENQTRNKIKDLVSPDMCDENTAMILVNTIYYKEIWKYAFKGNYSNGDPITDSFYLNETESIEINFMELRKDLYFTDYNNHEAKALKLSYRDSEVSIIIILPNSRTGLKNLENHMDSQHFNNIWDQMIETEVDMTIPKFKIEFEANLNEPLTCIYLANL